MKKNVKKSDGNWILKYYLDKKILGIHSENSKYKFYSSKVILSPSKYSPSTATYVSAWSSSRNISGTLLSVAIRAVFDFSITSFRLLKRVSRNGFFDSIEQKKIAGSHIRWIRWLLDGLFVSFLVKNSRIMALCDGALLWCKIHELFLNLKKSKIRAEVDILKTA